MNRIGIKKEIDKLGRIVIPREMRKLYNLEYKIELVMTEDGLLLRNPQYHLTEIYIQEKEGAEG